MFESATLDKIAVVRQLGLDGLLTAVPALRALRAAFPESLITWIGEPETRQAVSRFDYYVDEFLECPGFPGMSVREPQVGRMLSFFAEAQARRFDLAIQMHGCGVVSNPFTVMLGARHTAGFHLDGHYCPDEVRFLIYPFHETKVRRPIMLLEHLGISPQGENLEFPLGPQDWQDLELVEQEHLLAPFAYACVALGSGWLPHFWKADQLAALTRGLAPLGLKVVLIGSGDDNGYQGQAVQVRVDECIDLRGELGLGALGALVSQARLLICGRGGLSRLAEALKVPQLLLEAETPSHAHSPRADLCRVIPWATAATPQMVLSELDTFLASPPGKVPDSR